MFQKTNAGIYPIIRQADILELHYIRHHSCKAEYAKFRQSQVLAMFTQYAGCSDFVLLLRLYGNESTAGRSVMPKSGSLMFETQMGDCED
jgi:hypothetical protein